MTGGVIAVYAAFFATGAFSTLALTPVFRTLALRTGLVDHPGARKIHEHATPYGGGLAIYAAFVISACAAFAAWFFLTGDTAESRQALQSLIARCHAPNLLTRTAGLAIGGTAVFILGLADDRWRLSWRTKLAGQAAAAAILWWTGTRITLFVDSQIFSLAATVLWVVFITNAMNLLDNMDGLSAGVSAIAAAIFFASAVQMDQPAVACLLATLTGACLGFLRYNYAPASVFMGDAGALFLGFILSAAAISGTYYAGPGHALSVAIPPVALAIPIFDTLSVMLIRWRTGKPLFCGDTNHFSHRLVRLGLSRPMAVLTIYMLSLSLGLMALMLPQLTGTGEVLALLHTAGILCVIGVLEYAAACRRNGEAP